MGWHEHGPKTWARKPGPARKQLGRAGTARRAGWAVPEISAHRAARYGTVSWAVPGPARHEKARERPGLGPITAQRTTQPPNLLAQTLSTDLTLLALPSIEPQRRSGGGDAQRHRRRPGASGGRMADPGLQVRRRPASSTGRKGRRRARIQGGRKPSTGAARRKRMEQDPQAAPSRIRTQDHTRCRRRRGHTIS